MLKIVQFLQENPYILNLLKENKVSLVGVNTNEQRALIEAFDEESIKEKNIWS